MKRYVIERHLPRIGESSSQDLRTAAQKSNAALAQLGKDIQWVESFVVGDATFCIYLATDEALIHEHARLSGFPANRVLEVKRIIDPTTAGAATRLRA